MAAIVDRSVLYALADRAEPAHQACADAIGAEVEVVVVPQPVLVEACYLVASRLGAASEHVLLTGLLGSEWRLEPLTEADIRRSADLVREYADAAIGFVDAALVAVAERLAVTRVYTLDRRHFGFIRPHHTHRFELLP